MVFGITGVAAALDSTSTSAVNSTRIVSSGLELHGAAPLPLGDRITRGDPTTHTGAYNNAILTAYAANSSSAAISSLHHVTTPDVSGASQASRQPGSTSNSRLAAANRGGAEPRGQSAEVLGAVGEFVNGLAQGGNDGLIGMVKGVGTLAKSSYDMATSADTRQRVLGAAVKDAEGAGRFAATAATNPTRTAAQAADVISRTWQHVSLAYSQAAAAGHGAEFLGNVVGQGAVLAGTALVPGGAAVDGVAAASDAGRIAGAVGDLARAGQLTGNRADLVRTSADAVSAAWARAQSERVTVYRVEGAANQRVFIGENGSVAVPRVLAKSGTERNLYLNFGDEARAQQFLRQRLASFPDSTVKTFGVPRSFVDHLRSTAVPESQRSLYPHSPVIADPTKAADQFGLSGRQINELRGVIIDGSGMNRGG